MLSTATTFTIDGGVDALDTDEEKAKFAVAIVEAIAAGPNSLKVEVRVLRVAPAATDARRLAVRGSNPMDETYDSMVQLAITAGLGENFFDTFQDYWSPA